MPQMARQRSTLRAKKAKATSKTLRTKVRRGAAKPGSLIGVRETQHARLTAGRSHGRPVMGMFQKASVMPAGKTAHFEVAYLTKLGKKGADLAQALLQNCE